MNPSRKRRFKALELANKELVSAETVVVEAVLETVKEVKEETAAVESVQDTTEAQEVSTEILQPAPTKRTKKSTVTE